MLQSNSNCSEEADNGNDFGILNIKMEHSMDRLNFIKQLLNNKNKKSLLIENERLIKLEEECLTLKTQLHQANQKLLDEKLKLKSMQEQNNDIQQKLNRQQDKYNADFQSWQDTLNNSQEEYSKINQDYTLLKENKLSIENELNRLQDIYNKEVERKNQLDLILKENAQELKIATEALIERDQKLEEHQQNIIKIQQMMDEKDDLLETYVKEAQANSEEYHQLCDNLNELEKENTELKDLLDKQSTPVKKEKLSYDSVNQQSHDVYPNFENHSSTPYTTKLETSKSSTHNSRIPVPVYHRTGSLQDHNLEIQKLKEDLIICNEKLMEKTSQYNELESAMQRSTDHCELLRTNLTLSQEESASRYRKMLDLMEENRILKEAINTKRI